MNFLSFSIDLVLKTFTVYVWGVINYKYCWWKWPVLFSSLS